MNEMESLRAVANAVLYEGYMLYPYRPSALKNQRPGWSFGTLLPPSYVATSAGESSIMEGQVLTSISAQAEITVEARFLQLSDANNNGAVERSVLTRKCLSDLLGRHIAIPFTFQAASGALTLTAKQLPEGVAKVSLSVQNHSHSPETFSRRDDALQQALIAAHAVMIIENGEFISLLDPPEQFCGAVSQCRQTGVFPVMAGDPARRNAMLLSPIILYDYPQIAPESRGDFFDSSEIDEILTLRVMTLTDAEKQEMLASAHGRDVLQRTDAATPKDLMRLHGVFRNPAPAKEESHE